SRKKWVSSSVVSIAPVCRMVQARPASRRWYSCSGNEPVVARSRRFWSSGPMWVVTAGVGPTMSVPALHQSLCRAVDSPGTPRGAGATHTVHGRCEARQGRRDEGASVRQCVSERGMASAEPLAQIGQRLREVGEGEVAGAGQIGGREPADRRGIIGGV